MHFSQPEKVPGDVSLSDSIDSDREGNALSLMDVISVEDDMLENLDARDSCAKVRRCVEHCLTEREAKVISLRYGLDGEGPRTQREIASSCGISRSYVSRLEKKALGKTPGGNGERITGNRPGTCKIQVPGRLERSGQGCSAIS